MSFSFSTDLGSRSISQDGEPDWKPVLLPKAHPLSSLNLNSDNCKQTDLTYNLVLNITPKRRLLKSRDSEKRRDYRKEEEEENERQKTP